MSASPQTVTPVSSIGVSKSKNKPRSPMPIIWLGSIIGVGALLTVVVLIVQHALAARADDQTLSVAPSAAPAMASSATTNVDRSWFYGHDTCLATDCGKPTVQPRASTAPQPSAAPTSSNPYQQQTQQPGNGIDVGSLFMDPDKLAHGGGGQQRSSMDAAYDDDTSNGSVSSAVAYNGPTPTPAPNVPPVAAPLRENNPVADGQHNWRNATSVEPPASYFVVSFPAQIKITLDMNARSDRPGDLVGIVSENVTDSTRVHDVLIPRGTTVELGFHEVIAYGMNTVGILGERLKFPNGDTYTLPDFQSTDAAGAAGVPAHVDRHLNNILGTGLMLSLFGVLPVLANNGQGATVNTNGSVGSALLQSNLQSLSALQNAMIGPAIAQPPTLKVPIGQTLALTVTKDLVFPSAYPFPTLSEAP